MKTLKLLLLTVAFLLISNSTQAQFWKKLTKKAKEKIEREAEKRAERRMNEKIDKTFDIAEETIDGKNKNPKAPKQAVNLPESYHFEWEYNLKMESQEIKKKNKDMGDMKITYLLNSSSSAFGSRFEMGTENEMMKGMITIMDFDSGTNIMLMDMNGQKIIQQMPSSLNKNIDEVIDEQESKNYTITKTDTKVILGYSCQGFKITSDDGIVNAYIAKNAPVSFNNSISGNSKFTPKGFNPKWLKEFENGLMMEMNFKSSKKEKYNMKMTCVSLKKNPFTINISDYKSMGF